MSHLRYQAFDPRGTPFIFICKLPLILGGPFCECAQGISHKLARGGRAPVAIATGLASGLAWDFRDSAEPAVEYLLAWCHVCDPAKLGKRGCEVAPAIVRQ